MFIEQLGTSPSRDADASDAENGMMGVLLRAGRVFTVFIHTNLAERPLLLAPAGPVYVLGSADATQPCLGVPVDCMSK